MVGKMPFTVCRTLPCIMSTFIRKHLTYDERGTIQGVVVSSYYKYPSQGLRGSCLGLGVWVSTQV